MIASTHPGFASASQSFDVVIGAHDLVIDPTTQTLNSTIGGNLSYTFPLNTIQLDGQVISRLNMSSITADLGSNGGWLTFDNSSLLLSGQPAKGDKGTIITLTIQDVFEDIVQATIVVNLFDGLFATTLPSTLNATIGQKFSFVLNDTLFAASDVQVTVGFIPKDGDNWLSYDSGSRTISGTPDNNKAKSVEVDINASSASLSQKQTISFTVQTVNSVGSTLAPTTQSSSSSSNKALIIGLSIGCPIAAIFLFSALVCCYRNRRKSSKSSVRAGSPIPPISRPYNLTPDENWPLEEEEAWGEPRPLGGTELFKREVSGMFTLNASDVGTMGGKVGGYDQGPKNEKGLPTPMIGGPREPAKAARGSWRRSDGRDWSVARSSDASLATINTNEIFSVRLVQSPNPNAGGLNPISPALGGVSPLLSGMGIRGTAPVATVNPTPEDNRRYGNRSRDTTGMFLEGPSVVDKEGHHRESAGRMFSQSGRGSGLGRRKPDRNSRYSMDSVQSDDQRCACGENGRGTRHQKQESSNDTIDDTVEYPVSRISGPLSPISQNVDWDSSSGHVPIRPRLVDLIKEKTVESSSARRHGSGEIVFV